MNLKEYLEKITALNTPTEEYESLFACLSYLFLKKDMAMSKDSLTTPHQTYNEFPENTLINTINKKPTKEALETYETFLGENENMDLSTIETPLGGIIHLIILFNYNNTYIETLKTPKNPTPNQIKLSLIEEFLQKGINLNSVDALGNNFIQSAILNKVNQNFIFELLTLLQKYNINLKGINISQAMNNPLANNPDTREEFLKKIFMLGDINEIHDSFNLITNYPGKDEYDFSAITLEDLERILTTKLGNTTNIISEVKSFASRTFGALYYTGLEKQLLNFIQTGNEPTIINFSSLGDAINMPYPVSSNKAEKIKWLGIYLSYAYKTKSEYMSNVSQLHMSPLSYLSIEEQLSNLNEQLGRAKPVRNNNILSRKPTK